MEKMSLATPSMQDYAGSFPDKQHERDSTSTTNSGIE
jgi:hypothetical protein